MLEAEGNRALEGAEPKLTEDHVQYVRWEEGLDELAKARAHVDACRRSPRRMRARIMGVPPDPGKGHGMRPPGGARES